MLTLLLTLASAQVFIKDDGVAQGWAKTINCSGSGVTCAVDVPSRTLTLDISGGGGGGLPDGGDISGEPFVTYSATSVLAAERVLSAGNYTVIDVGTAAQAQVDWQHGLTCSAGQALTSSGTTALACTSTITASDVACAGTCVSSAEIVSVTGAQVSSAVATATALAANPTDCGANQFAQSIAASGNLTCAGIANGDLPVVDVTKGGTGVSTIAANQVLTGTAADVVTAKTLPSCSAADSALTFNNSTQTWGCNTITGGAGSSPLSVVLGTP